MDLATLSKAVHFLYPGTTQSQADEMAWDVLSYFGYSNRAIGNVFGPSELAMLYELEDEGMVKIEIREEPIKKSSKPWRVIEFILVERKIREIASRYDERLSSADNPTSSEFGIYDRLPVEMFPGQRHKH